MSTAEATLEMSADALATDISAVGSPAPTLRQILARDDVWRAESASCEMSRQQLVSTGFAALDEVLPGGGWPRGALTEVLTERFGSGELRLLLPALAALTTRDEWVGWLAPPWQLFAPALMAAGVKTDRLLVVSPGKEPGAPWWAAERMLRSGALGAALLWLPASARPAQLRRLQLAAVAGGTWAIFLQNARWGEQPSPAPLRLQVASRPGGVRVQLIKRRGAPLAMPVELSFDSPGQSPYDHSSHALAGRSLSLSAA